MKAIRRATALSLAAFLVFGTPGTAAWAAIADVSAGALTRGVGIAAAPTRIISIDPIAIAPTSAISAGTPLSLAAPAQPVSAIPVPAAALESLSGTDAAQAIVPTESPERTEQRLDALFEGSKKMPDGDDKDDGISIPAPNPDRGTPDEIGNPRRRGGEGGPDDPSDPDRRDGGDSLPFKALPGIAAGGAAALQADPVVGFVVTTLSLIVHEIGHARKAADLGDVTAVLAGRASWNPLRWGRHLSLYGSVLVPLAMIALHGPFFGWAKVVEPNRALIRGGIDMRAADAAMAWAGPRNNLIIAAVGTLAFGAATAVSAPILVTGTLATVVSVNVLLGIFNLTPVPPLDGGFIMLWGLSRKSPALARRVEAFFADVHPWALFAFAIGCAALVGYYVALPVAHFLLGAAAGSFAAALPAVGLIGMAGIVAADRPAPLDRSRRPAEFVVMFSPEKTVLRDVHLDDLETGRAGYAEDYARAQSEAMTELENIGLPADLLRQYNASPVAVYRRINAATIRLDSSAADEFERAMTERGHVVHSNDRRALSAPRLSPSEADATERRLAREAGFPLFRNSLRRFGNRLLAAFGLAPDGHARRLKFIEPRPAASNAATLDSLLRSLNSAANSGAPAVAAPWTDPAARPESPEARLADALAVEGIVQLYRDADGGIVLRHRDAAGAPVRSARIDASSPAALTSMMRTFDVSGTGVRLDAVAGALSDNGGDAAATFRVLDAARRRERYAAASPLLRLWLRLTRRAPADIGELP